MEDTRVCITCKKDKPTASAYGPPGKAGIRKKCRECEANYSRQWKKNNPQKAIAAGERSRSNRKAKPLEEREKDRQKKQECDRRYRERNLDRLKAYDRNRFHSAHRQQWLQRPENKARQAQWRRQYSGTATFKAKKRAFRVANRAGIASYMQAYRRKNRHRLVVLQNKRRTRQFNHAPMDVDYIQELRKEQKCWYCHVPFSGSCVCIDHVIPISKGGSNDKTNLAACCGKCNSSKGAKLPQEWCGPAFDKESWLGLWEQHVG